MMRQQFQTNKGFGNDKAPVKKKQSLKPILINNRANAV